MLDEIRSIRIIFWTGHVPADHHETSVAPTALPDLDACLRKYEPIIMKIDSAEVLGALTELYISDLRLCDSMRSSTVRRSADGGAGSLVCGLLFVASAFGMVYGVYEQQWLLALACAFAGHLLALTWWAIRRPLPDPALNP